MPSTSLCGVRLRQVANDFLPFYLPIAVTQVIWLFIYWIGIAAFSRPEPCNPGSSSTDGQQYAVVFVCLGFFIAQAAATCALTLLTLKGTPLEPSRRRWVDRLLCLFVLSLPVNAGLLAWGGWVVLAGDGSCWSGGEKSMPDSIFFGGFGTLLAQAISFAIGLNQLGDVRRDSGWWALSTRTGASKLTGRLASWGARYRGPTAQLEMLATQLQARLGSVQADKTDVAALLACAALVQDEAAVGQGAAPAAEAAEAGSEDGAALARADKADDGPLMAWARGVCEGAAAPAVPQPEGGAAPADAEAAAEALHWARYAAAAYGEQQHAWRRGKTSSWAASRQLSHLVGAAKAERAQPLAGWGSLGAAAAGAGAGSSPGKPSQAQLRDFAAAWDLLGPACQLVALSRGDSKARLPPHLLAVDREKQAVVLGIGGDLLQPHVSADTAPVPASWLDGCTAAAAEQGAVDGSLSGSPDGAWAHAGSLKAAEALLRELERSQLLQRLLRGAGDNGAAAGALAGVRCSSWQLVLVGHGEGAGAAALLAPRLAAMQLGQLSVWAFGPPGELCSAGLGAAVAASCRLMVVAVGDDAAPRTSQASVAALLDQGMVGLARLRYPKMGLLAALVGERLGPKRWRGRWVTPKRALRPLGEVPPEARAWLQRYYDARPAPAPPSSLPGRVLLLSRVPPAAAGGAEGAPAAGGSDAAPADDASVSSGSSSSSSGSSQNEESWQAGWASGDQLAGWGIRSSRGALYDHHVSRLLGVLSELAAPSADEGAGVDEGGASVEGSRQPLHIHKHSD